MNDKKADLAGPGISTYKEVNKILPSDYNSLLNRKATQKALWDLKYFFEKNLCKELNLMMVTCPLIVDKESGFNDMLDRDGSRTPVSFPCGLGLKKPIDAQIVQAVTKWKRFALRQYDMDIGEGLCTDMRAVRKDYFLDHDHSSYVGQWDWEKIITKNDRTLEYLKDTVKKIWNVFKGAEKYALDHYPVLDDPQFPNLPDKLEFFHAEEILDMYPNLPRKQRETKIIQDHPAIFIIGIGWPLKDGYPHEMRAADYDDWVTETITKNGETYHGLNGDILVWNPVTERRHELSSMGVRVTPETLKKQLDMSGQLDSLNYPYHKMIMNMEIPLSIGGGIGQERSFMLLLKKAHLGEVSNTVWPSELKEICVKKNIHVLQ